MFQYVVGMGVVTVLQFLCLKAFVILVEPYIYYVKHLHMYEKFFTNKV